MFLHSSNTAISAKATNIHPVRMPRRAPRSQPAVYSGEESAIWVLSSVHGRHQAEQDPSQAGAHLPLFVTRASPRRGSQLLVHLGRRRCLLGFLARQVHQAIAVSGRLGDACADISLRHRGVFS